MLKSTKNYLIIKRLISYILFFTCIFTFPFNNEIQGKFIYDVDLEKNELYVFDNQISLTTYDLTNDTIKSKYKFDAFVPDFNNATWNGFYTGEFSLSKSVMNGLMDNLVLKKSENEKFYIFHDGGGLVMSLIDGRLKRLDNSFPFMNKFLGDFILYDKKVYHFGGYGLFRTNNAMLNFDENNTNQWDEITFQNDIPSELSLGISSFHSLLIKNNYYIFGGNKFNNGRNSKNESIFKFDFENYFWTKLGNINLNLTDDPLILGSGNWFYVFGQEFFHFIDIEKSSIYKYNYKLGFSPSDLSSFKSFISYNNTFENINTLDISDVTLNIFKNHNSKTETVILSKYKLGNIIEIDSISELPLMKYEQSRNQFFIPILIVLVIIIINLLYVGLNKKPVSEPKKLFSFENNELFFMSTKINLDNNSLEIINMLYKNNSITSNEIVAKLVENGLSYDYASKVKNKIIESLNEKFEFITSSSEPFIKISKSSQDKRIQILSLNNK